MVIHINKPVGMTSHDVVDAVRRITGEGRVGHAGTLDPFANGVLVVAVGREDTKKLGAIAEHAEKEYVAVLELGKTSSTGDPTGVVQEILRPCSGQAKITNNKIQKALKAFVGDIVQTSPPYSAVRVKGVRAYRLAHQGKTVAMPKRMVSIYELDLLEFEPPLAKLRVVCSTGTYIRQLAQDIGEALGVGAYLIALTRTRIGQYKIEDSKTLDELKTFLHNQN